MNIQVEIACGSLAEVHTAIAAGADRIELNAALSLGGLTPSIGALRETFKMVRSSGSSVEILPMLRPCGGGFCYDAFDFKTMLEDASILIAEGSPGFVFGITKSDNTIDKERCEQIVKLAAGKDIIFHRAFDTVPNWKAALDTLCDLGFRRVLSSGLTSNAEDGIKTLKAMCEYAAGRIEILPGGGVRSNNVGKILNETGCNQAHFSLRKTETEFFNQEEAALMIQVAKNN
ncbi:MAG: copper homeostasis protein CutC [Termitinemataceae bacterium]|nr:MAG: copper homeostasis protein CutC [Termitinemataceae bacterium]